MTRSRRCLGPSDRDPLLSSGLRPGEAHLQRRSAAAEPGWGACQGSRLLPRDPVGESDRSGLPLVGDLARELPWYLRDIALPGASATVLSAIRVEGRTFHLAAQALVRFWTGPRRLAGARRCAAMGEFWRPEEIVMLPDGSDSRMRRLRYTGPGAVLVLVEHERRGRAMEQGSSATARPGLRPVLTLRQPTGARALERGRVISLGSGARLLVRSHAAGSR